MKFSIDFVLHSRHTPQYNHRVIHRFRRICEMINALLNLQSPQGLLVWAGRYPNDDAATNFLAQRIYGYMYQESHCKRIFAHLAKARHRRIAAKLIRVLHEMFELPECQQYGVGAFLETFVRP